MIAKERQGQTVNTSVLSKIASSYVDLGSDPEDLQQRIQDGLNLANVTEMDSDQEKLGTYRVRFEVPFLNETQTFYTHEATTFLASHSVTEYTKKVRKKRKT